MKFIRNFAMVASALAMVACGTSDPQLGKASVDEVIKAMTLEEKAHFVIGTGMAGFATGDQTVIGETQEVVPGAAGTTYAIERLGIPSVALADGPAGLRISAIRPNDPNTYYCTHFPIGTLLASTWNQELVEQVGEAIGNEVLEYGADVLLAPALNIHRNPLCGRNFEYYSEDPVVAGKTAAAYVRGVQSNGVGTSVKHFAVNSQESNRNANDARVSPRALREIYLKGFEITVKESDPWTFMSSYNHINGIYASHNTDLLTHVLRDDWGYKGMVMTDWFGGNDPVEQMIAGNDMLQPGLESQAEAIIKGVEEGVLDVAYLDRNVKRILEMILKTPHFKGYNFSNKPDLEAHAAVTRQSATEGMVLLKNEGKALPLADVKNVALYGCTSYAFIAGGTGSGDVNRAYTVSLTEGLENAGYTLDAGLKETYEKYVAEEKAKAAAAKGNNPMAAFMPDDLPAEFVPAGISEQAEAADVAIITLGRLSGEGSDRTLDDFELGKNEKALIQSVCAAFHAAGKKVIVVLNVGGVIETSSWKNLPDAILCAWQAGQEGGNSVADVLSGKANPSGKLTMTFPIRWADAASSANFPTEGRGGIGGGIPDDFDFDNFEPGNIDIGAMLQGSQSGEPENLWDYTNYEEDIYVGYRYFDTFGKDVSYPFGYGLSYTTFEYSDAAINAANDEFTVTVKVKNTGDVAGKEVVELYISAPKSNLEKPAKELKAYAKTALLQPGETATVTLKVKASELASFDEAASSWVTDEGDYKFLVGASSRDIKAELTAHCGAWSEKVSNSFALQTDLKRLTK